MSSVDDSVEPVRAGHQRSVINRLLSGGGWSLLEVVVAAAAAIAVNGLLARLLDEQGFGAYLLGQAVVLGAAVVGRLGLSQTALRMVAAAMATGEGARARAVVVTTFRIGAVSALISLVVVSSGLGRLLAVEVFESRRLANVMAFVGVWVALQILQGLLTEALRGFHDFRAATLSGRLTTGVLLVPPLVVMWTWQRPASLELVMVLTLAATAAPLALGAFALARRTRNLHRGGSASAGELISVSSSVLFSEIAWVMLHLRGELWILGWARTESEVALYGAALQLAALAELPLRVLYSTLPPLISELHASGRRSLLWLLIRTSVGIAALPSVAALLVFSLCGDWILSFVYGPGYEHAATVLVILCAGRVIHVACGPTGMTLIMIGHERVTMWLNFSTTTVTMVAAVIMSTTYGMLGLALAMSGGIALGGVVGVVTVKYVADAWVVAALPTPRAIKQFATQPLGPH